MSKPSAQDIAERLSRRFGVQGKTAIVTGGTEGIGRSVVEELAKLGAVVVTCARRAEALEAALAEWQAQGLQVYGCVADVSKPADRDALMAEAEKHCNGKLDILINNVGTNIRKLAVDASLEDFQFLMSTNVESAFAMCKLAYPLLKASGDASVIFNSSVAGGPTAMKSGCIYAMTKASLNMLAKSLTCEWSKDNIRVNSVAPWYTNTPLAKPVLQDEAVKTAVVGRTPMGRVAEPEEVSGALCLLSLGPGPALVGFG